MTDASSLFESIRGISSRVSDNMSEQDVENAFLNESFFQVLGYEGAGVDLRSEFTLPDDSARYVYESVNGRRVKSGEETSIPIPRQANRRFAYRRESSNSRDSDDGVHELLSALDGDRGRVESTDIDALEAEIDEAVYDLFDLDESEREVIEEYLEVF